MLNSPATLSQGSDGVPATCGGVPEAITFGADEALLQAADVLRTALSFHAEAAARTLGHKVEAAVPA